MTRAKLVVVVMKRERAKETWNVDDWIRRLSAAHLAGAARGPMRAAYFDCYGTSLAGRD